jgi:hypothetical protein
MKLARGAPFFAGVWAGSAPLLVWALHFAFCYVAVAVMCTSAVNAGLDEPRALHGSLAAATALAFVTLAAMLWRTRSPAPQASYLQLMRRVASTLALIGVAWMGVPMAMLPACAP